MIQAKKEAESWAQAAHTREGFVKQFEKTLR